MNARCWSKIAAFMNIYTNVSALSSYCAFSICLAVAYAVHITTGTHKPRSDQKHHLYHKVILAPILMGHLHWVTQLLSPEVRARVCCHVAERCYTLCNCQISSCPFPGKGGGGEYRSQYRDIGYSYILLPRGVSTLWISTLYYRRHCRYGVVQPLIQSVLVVGPSAQGVSESAVRGAGNSTANVIVASTRPRWNAFTSGPVSLNRTVLAVTHFPQVVAYIFFFNPFTAPDCKISGLKVARTRLQTVNFSVR